MPLPPLWCGKWVCHASNHSKIAVLCALPSSPLWCGTPESCSAGLRSAQSAYNFHALFVCTFLRSLPRRAFALPKVHAIPTHFPYALSSGAFLGWPSAGQKCIQFPRTFCMHFPLHGPAVSFRSKAGPAFPIHCRLEFPIHGSALSFRSTRIRRFLKLGCLSFQVLGKL